VGWGGTSGGKKKLSQLMILRIERTKDARNGSGSNSSEECLLCASSVEPELRRKVPNLGTKKK